MDKKADGYELCDLIDVGEAGRAKLKLRTPGGEYVPGILHMDLSSDPDDVYLLVKMHVRLNRKNANSP